MEVSYRRGFHVNDSIRSKALFSLYKNRLTTKPKIIDQSAYPLDVTVIIPTFRRQKQLKEAIQSVIDEKGLKMEIFVVDDSPDGCARAVIDSMVNKGIVTKNKAARHKSRLNARVKALSA